MVGFFDRARAFLNTTFGNQKMTTESPKKSAPLVFQMSGGSMITINGVEYQGNHIAMDGNGVVTVDGVIQGAPKVGPIAIKIMGSVDTLSVSQGKVEVEGDAKSIKTVSGEVVVCGKCDGNIQTTSGEVTTGALTGQIRTISGDVAVMGSSGEITTASGDVDVKGSVSGSIKSLSGSIRHG